MRRISKLSTRGVSEPAKRTLRISRRLRRTAGVWRSTTSTPIPTRRSRCLTEFCASMGVKVASPRRLPRGAQAATALAEGGHAVCARRHDLPSRPVRGRAFASRRRSRLSPRRIYRAEGVDFTPAAERAAVRSRRTHGYGTPAGLHLQRRSIPCRTTRRCWAVRRATASRSANLASRQARALSWRWPVARS